MNVGRIGAVLFGVVLLVGGLIAIVWQERVLRTEMAGLQWESATFELMGTLPRALRETSGIATSHRYPGIFWTHNDSGDGANLFAVDMTGAIVARFRVRDAGSNDWEDIGRGPCPVSLSADVDCLYIADTGNNTRDRRRLSIYVVQEPDPTAGTADEPLSAGVDGARLRFVYPDSRRDAEAIAVDADGNLLIVNRGRHRDITVYRIAADVVDGALGDSDEVVAESLGPVPFTRDRRSGRVVTGAAWSPFDEALLVRTYTGVWTLRESESGWEELARCEFGWQESAGEAIDVLDDTWWVVTSEAGGASPATMHRVRCDEDRLGGDASVNVVSAGGAVKLWYERDRDRS